MVQFSDFYVKDLKMIIKEYNLHHHINIKGLKKNDLVAHIENYLYIDGDRIKEHMIHQEYKIPKIKEKVDRTHLKELRKIYFKIKRKYDSPNLSNREANKLVPDMNAAYKAIRDEERRLGSLNKKL